MDLKKKEIEIKPSTMRGKNPNELKFIRAEFVKWHF